MERESFVFYRSFYEAIKELPAENQANVYNALFEYSFNNVEVELSGIEKAVFLLMKPQVDANQKKYENGCKGGRPKKQNQEETEIKPNQNQNETKTKPKQNQNKTKVKPNDNDNDNVNDNVNDNDNDNDNDNTGSGGCADGFPQSDGRADEIVKFYEENIGAITPYEFTLLDSYRKDFSDDIIIYALKLQVEAKATSIKYAKAILNNWIAKGIKTLLDAQREDDKKGEGHSFFNL